MKKNYHLTHEAKIDLKQIRKFTKKKWSTRQADSYYRLIIKQIEYLCENSDMGRPIDDILEGHRIAKVESHRIIYRITENIIYVQRILHEKMDIESRLK